MPFEVCWLGRTITRWASQMVAWHLTHFSNRPAEAVNNPAKLIEQVEFGLVSAVGAASGRVDPGESGQGRRPSMSCTTYDWGVLSRDLKQRALVCCRDVLYLPATESHQTAQFPTSNASDLGTIELQIIIDVW